MAKGGILDKVFGGGSLLELGGSILGIDPTITKFVGGAAQKAMGDSRESGSGYQRHTSAVDYAPSAETQRMVGPGEIKASMAVEYDDEMAEAMAIIRNYAQAE
tara:strand:- start:409 stop:717 length:309 start_codon:yes stop_codon:yes gene_type:complete